MNEKQKSDKILRVKVFLVFLAVAALYSWHHLIPNNNRFGFELDRVLSDDGYVIFSRAIDGSKCLLKEVEANWISIQIAKGDLSVSSEKELHGWERKAKMRGVEHPLIEPPCSLALTVRNDKFSIPRGVLDESLSTSLVFLVPKDIEFPKVLGGSAVYDMSTGGMYMSGYWIEGKAFDSGYHPRFNPK